VQLRAHHRRLGHRGDHVGGEVAGVWRGEPQPFQTVHPAAGAEQFGERAAVAERHPVGVHVLPEQGHLEHAVRGERGHLGQHVAGPPVLFAPAQRGDDAERAAVVAAHRDRHPAGVGGLAAGRQRRREDLERVPDLHLCGVVVPRPLE
jgi:hypothetical protein